LSYDDATIIDALNNALKAGAGDKLTSIIASETAISNIAAFFNSLNMRSSTKRTDK
jgi:hypothetical protein